MAAYELVKSLGSFLESGYKDRLTAASDFSLMTNETINIMDCGKLAIFGGYIDLSSGEVQKNIS